ncbi:MAG: GspE/PulE family protein, partial [Candidatus Roizmanbacteria bacterium]|nr:GspE/PulE family protein [Candidatus Roizmanbacteria bacterium]
EEELAQILAQKYGLPYIDLSKLSVSTDALRMVPESESRAAHLAAFKLIGKELHIVATSPTNEKVIAILEDLRAKNYGAILYLGSKASLERAWERYQEVADSSRTTAGVIDISDEELSKFFDKLSSVASIKETIENEQSEVRAGKGISNIVEVILAGAVAIESSDIHIEPQEGQIRLRYRLDGVLQDIAFLTSNTYHPILSRIKLVSGMKLNVKEMSQDGRFSIKIKGLEIEIRTSVIPGAYGESVVMRVLNPKTIALTFENLGVEPQLFSILSREIEKPNGMILLTGPTGSGKTTTLYAFLRRVSNTGNKIITIEDPIEYHLEGINQTQVNDKEGYSFLEGLRSALRQDPDIIMVGEIRDKETAKIAINAALTGHLVFSTLHTNNAAGTIPRLIDLDINPKVISSALNVAIAQRLLRKLCVKCKKEAVPTPEERTLMDTVIERIKKKKPDLTLPSGDHYYVEVGCPDCNGTGFHGREGIYEAVLSDPLVTEVTLKNPSEREIKIAALPQRILNMREDGMVKVLEGSTSLSELGRVIDLNEEII